MRLSSSCNSLILTFSSLFFLSLILGLSGAMASISVRSGPPGSPTHPAQSLSRRRNGLHDVDLNTFIAEEMALHLDSTANRKRGPAPCSDVITDSPTHKRNRMLWTFPTPLIPPLSSPWWPIGQLMRTDALANLWNLPPFHLSCNATNKEPYLLPILTFFPFSFTPRVTSSP